MAESALTSTFTYRTGRPPLLGRHAICLMRSVAHSWCGVQMVASRPSAHPLLRRALRLGLSSMEIYPAKGPLAGLFGKRTRNVTFDPNPGNQDALDSNLGCASERG